MIKVKMPLNFRMQNFLFIDNEIFWTSSSKSIIQKIKDLIKKPTYGYCNTSLGVMRGHGQRIRFFNGRIYSYDNGSEYSYNPVTGGYIGKHKPITSPPTSHLSEQYLQGLSFKDNGYTHALFGTPGKKNIEVYDLSDDSRYISLAYNTYKKWWWKHWEAEGIQWHDNKLYIGISVKSKFGFIINYIKEV